MKIKRCDLIAAIIAILALGTATSVSWKMSSELWEYDWDYILPMMSGFMLTMLSVVFLARPRKVS